MPARGSLEDETRRVIRIPRGAELLKWSLQRLPPTSTRSESVDIEYTIHRDLQIWLERMAKDGMLDHKQPVIVPFDDGTTRGPQQIQIMDGGGEEAWNLNLSRTISRTDTPSLRLDHDWTLNLGFLRLCVHSLHRHLRITMRDNTDAQQLWAPKYCNLRHTEVPCVDAYLLASVEKLRTAHITWPKTIKTTVVISHT